MKLITERPIRYNELVYIQINDNKPTRGYLGKFFAEKNFGVIEIFINEAIQNHLERYPNEPISSLKFITNAIKKTEI